jgi:hypothetical protein
MISTVTTTTVTTIVTLTSAGASLGVLGTILLIAFLGTQEFVSADTRRSLKTLGRHLNVVILPLLLVFALIVTFKILGVA